MKRAKGAVDTKTIEAEENLLIDYQFLLQELMVSKNVSRTELAEKAGISKARLSQIFSAEANPTLKTFARLFYALGEEIQVGLKSFEEVKDSKLSDAWLSASPRPGPLFAPLSWISKRVPEPPFIIPRVELACPVGHSREQVFLSHGAPVTSY